MGTGYTRNDTSNNIADGNVINAAPLDGEFDALVSAFAASTGHSHDGTSAEGGPVSKLGPSAQLEQTSAALVPSSNNTIDLGTTSAEFKDLFLDGTANIDSLVADTADINAGSIDGVTLGTNSAVTQAVIDNINIDGATIGHTSDTDLLTLASGIVTVAGEISVTTLDIGGTNVTATATELNKLDGANVTVAEINILDGDTSATGTTIADADRVVLNDSGTMVQVAVTDLAAYFDDEITAMPNLVTTAATTVGALDSGSITSGFGTINTGSSAITTTGLISGGSLDIDNVLINGTNIGHTDDTDLLTLANGLVTVAGEISVTTLDIGGTNVTSTATELNKLDGANVTTTEINIIDGDTSVGTTAVAGGDGVVTNDNGTMRQTSVDTFDTYLSQTSKTLTNKTLTTPTITTPVVNAGLQLKNGSTSAGFLEFFEDSDNGTNKVTLIGPADTADVTVTLPSTATTLAGLAVAQEFTASQNFDEQTLTDGSNIDWNLQTQQVSTVTLAGNRTFNAPSNHVAGLVCVLTIVQDGSGSRTATFNSAFKFTGGSAPTLTTTASARDILVFISDGTNLREIGRSLNPS